MYRNRGIALSDLLFLLLIVVGAFLSYKYVPLIMKKGYLELLLKEESYGAKGKPVEVVQQAVVDSAARRLNIHLNIEDVIVDKMADRVVIEVHWPVDVDLIADVVHHDFHVRQETVFY